MMFHQTAFCRRRMPTANYIRDWTQKASRSLCSFCRDDVILRKKLNLKVFRNHGHSDEEQGPDFHDEVKFVICTSLYEATSDKTTRRR